MDQFSTQSLSFNSTNFTCTTPLLWTKEATEDRRARLIACSVAVFTHTAFWLQLLFCPSVRQKSMQWIYAYLVTDILLLMRFFFIYIVRITATECEPTKLWFYFVCYVEATVDNYLNVLEVYMLLALNICRYIQIAYNKNVYQLHKKLLLVTHITMYVSTAFSFIIQFSVKWARLDIKFQDSCQVTYTNIYIQVFNIITAFALPILLNVVVIYMSARHVRLTSTLQRATHVSAREKYNRSLVIQFLIFYIIWVALWSPNVILFQIAGGGTLTATFRLLNFIEIALDPLIIAALDVRFWQAWQKFGQYVRVEIVKRGSTAGRIGPTTTRVNVVSFKTVQQQTTNI
ncbi:unnamed protein product [Adineta ricciae]|uniref:G-protein coupled receptors family 1 profile domain-containing protein n=1 Tax=Adineta ricciae TaxID=249248 RepID=A0A813ML19_ADIRI|nr:unnamed protein product [Adineta ricciae]CAF1196789.1 unnamed protein product [Adineta ricciae]